MTPLQKEDAVELLEKMIELIKHNDTEWVHVTVKTDTMRLTVATSLAPKRPKGL
jgi:hypothetical protein